MKVILRQAVENLGEPGTLHKVADGYGRNYLIPKGYAVLATPGEMKTYENNLREHEMKIGRQERALQSFADRIAAVKLHFEAQAGETGRLFGSVTANDIAEKISSVIGEEIDRRKVILDEPIRHVGDYTVHVHVVGKLKPAVQVKVTAVAGESPTADETVTAEGETAAAVAAE